MDVAERKELELFAAALQGLLASPNSIRTLTKPDEVVEPQVIEKTVHRAWAIASAMVRAQPR